ncbi:glycosyltransferase 87 family protein [Novosphingobium terrae]|uniref:glycosyltransferase 87 family protein n=1 Tax=Novosphingobium terrae TaxID=2726189 RepID=UPI001980DC1C|nr:glycosyltransferase 87 family protein [Novosphingobium terrae]
MDNKMTTQRGDSLPFLVYLNFAILLPISFFQNGLPRFALLTVFGLGFLFLITNRRARPVLDDMLKQIGVAGRWVLFEVMPAMVLLISLRSPNKVRIWEALVVLVLIGALLWRDDRIARNPKRALDGMPWFGWILLLFALSVPLLNLASGLLVPKLSDVATTTVDAARLLLEGQNPYAAALDPYGAANAHDPAFGGYKYLPLMILTHMPFVVPMGPLAVLGINLLLVTLLCGVIWKLLERKAQDAVTSDERLVVLAVLLATPELAESALAMGFNDLAGTVLVLGAFLLRERSAMLAGLFVGCSLSCKLMPGLAAATIVFPPERWKHYLLGMALGLLPTLVFLVWEPQAFIRNVLLFNLVRSPDPTSWRMLRRPGSVVPPVLARWPRGWPVRSG